MFKILGGDKDRSHALFTTINGIGLWSNWTRSFKQPFMALLDLLDNSIDATLHQLNFKAQVQIQILSSADKTGMLITNNASESIKPLSDCLKIYNSAKEGDDSYIGENGVGLKQGCAALSDLSFIFCRRGNFIEIGIIAKSLQKATGCWLPCFKFHVSVQEILTATEEQRIALITREVDSICAHHEDIATCIEQVEKRTLSYLVAKHLFHSRWQQDGETTKTNDVFCIYLVKLKHNNESIVDEIHTKLPQHYIHIDGINLQVNQKSISSAYWQRRLVEFSRFQVNVNKQTFLYEFRKNQKGNDWIKCGYPLRVFVGFDPLRIGALTLLIYSRKSGRLIKQFDDARHMLGLSHSGSDYCQGLTVIVDDFNGMLPLTPSKQDIAFSEESGGEAHEHNFFSWVGAVSKFYWNFHADRLAPDGVDRKSQLSKVIEAHRSKVEKMLKASSMTFTPLRHVDLSRFEDIPWLSRQKQVKKHKVTPIYTISPKNMDQSRYTYILGNDTLLKLKELERKVAENTDEAVKKSEAVKKLKIEKDAKNEVPLSEDEEGESVSSSSSSSYEPESRPWRRSFPHPVTTATTIDPVSTTVEEEDSKVREQRMIRMISEDIDNGSTSGCKRKRDTKGSSKAKDLQKKVEKSQKELEKYKALWAEEKKKAAKYVSLWKNERRKLEATRAAYNTLKRSSGMEE